LDSVFTATPALLLFFAAAAGLGILTCVVKKGKLVVTAVNLLVHIAAVYCFVMCGAEMDELLIFFLFSILVSLFAGDYFRRKSGKPDEEKKEENKE